MLFINNKYTKWYFNIIEQAIQSPPNTYAEKHRILPGCMGGKYEEGNVVHLSARQHYICHQLLVRMTIGKHQELLSHAAWQFANGCKSKGQERTYKVSSRMYESAMRFRRKTVSKATSKRNLKNWQDPEYRASMISKLQKTCKEVWADPDLRKTQSDTIKEVWKDPAYRENQKIVAVTKWTEERKAKQAATIRAKWADPEYRTMMAEARKAK